MGYDALYFKETALFFLGGHCVAIILLLVKISLNQNGKMIIYEEKILVMANLLRFKNKRLFHNEQSEFVICRI